MKKILCPACGGDTKRNGKTSSGATRWRCKACGASTTQRYDNEPKLLELFLRWLLSKKDPRRVRHARTHLPASHE
ncbi:transposase [Eggerthella sp. 1_3_56FAA]|nr:transposase [Eggerthella sp. 1_3_56FAA]